VFGLGVGGIGVGNDLTGGNPPLVSTDAVFGVAPAAVAHALPRTGRGTGHALDRMQAHGLALAGVGGIGGGGVYRLGDHAHRGAPAHRAR
jgi:hypothetical protein